MALPHQAPSKATVSLEGWKGKILTRRTGRREIKKQEAEREKTKGDRDIKVGEGNRARAKARTATHHGAQEAPLQGMESGHSHAPCSSPFVAEDLLLLPFIAEVLTGHHLQRRQGWGQQSSLGPRLTREARGLSYHGDQEQVRRGHVLQVVRVSVPEPFDVHQSQHHSTRGDARLPGRWEGAVIKPMGFSALVTPEAHPCVFTASLQR